MLLFQVVNMLCTVQMTQVIDGLADLLHIINITSNYGKYEKLSAN